MSGVQHGLTMVVGPPGTGKTDTAVQIMHVLYHNQPEQRTLLITHSNQVSHFTLHLRHRLTLRLDTLSPTSADFRYRSALNVDSHQDVPPFL